ATARERAAKKGPPYGQNNVISWSAAPHSDAGRVWPFHHEQEPEPWGAGTNPRADGDLHDRPLRPGRASRRHRLLLRLQTPDADSRRRRGPRGRRATKEGRDLPDRGGRRRRRQRIRRGREWYDHRGP